MHQIESARVAPTFEDLTDNPIQRKKIQLRRRQWQRLKAIAEVEGRGLSQVIEFFLTWAEEDWRRNTRSTKIDAYKERLARIELAPDTDSEEEDGPQRTPPPVSRKNNNKR